MNPLNNFPHLFANGSFKVKYKDRVWPIDGYCDGCLIFINSEYPIEYCTLIARPISDMSDEEIFGLYDHIEKLYTADDYREILRQKARDDRLQFRMVRKLADHGVYFGPQSHFEDGTVLNEAEIRNKMG